MKIMVEITPEAEEWLQEEAAHRGIAAEDYVRWMIEARVLGIEQADAAIGRVDALGQGEHFQSCHTPQVISAINTSASQDNAQRAAAPGQGEHPL